MCSVNRSFRVEEAKKVIVSMGNRDIIGGLKKREKQKDAWKETYL
jgi:hypothetical protein